MNEKKELLKTTIQKIFTKLRNALNDREDELLLEVDKQYKELFFDEDIIKKSEKLPNKINLSLEKGKLIDKNWNKNNKLNYKINECLIIEENIKDINDVKERLQNCSFNNDYIHFEPNEDGVNQILNSLKNFGNIKNKVEIFANSKIDFDENLVISWLNNRNFNTELLYRKTRDGSNVKDFHNKCDNKGNTIIFIETTKGYKFGGYTELQWDGSCQSKTDKSTFLFSFNKKQKFIAKNKKESIIIIHF